MQYEYDKECLLFFLENQKQLFDEPVADSLEEANEFLEECMAVVVDSLEEIVEYWKETGADIEGMSLKDIEESLEVFSLPSGRYLLVEG